ncbi:MAG: hypothetical protein WDO73_00260 [Ignavibacteriota bacterium]
MASIGVLGGLLRDLAPTAEEVWRFTPYPDLNIYRFLKEKRDHRRTGFQLIFFAAILCAEALRQGLGDLFRNGKRWKSRLLSQNGLVGRTRPLARDCRDLCIYFVRRRHPVEDLEQHA